MEMTGSFELDKPVLLAAVLAFGLSRRFGLNIYDSGEPAHRGSLGARYHCEP